MTAATAAPSTRLAVRQRRRLLDAIGLAVAAASGVVSRRPVRPLGDEERRALPGDALLPDAKGRWTHAITIHATHRRPRSGPGWCRWGSKSAAGTLWATTTTIGSPREGRR